MDINFKYISVILISILLIIYTLSCNCANRVINERFNVNGQYNDNCPSLMLDMVGTCCDEMTNCCGSIPYPETCINSSNCTNSVNNVLTNCSNIFQDEKKMENLDKLNECRPDQLCYRTIKKLNASCCNYKDEENCNNGYPSICDKKCEVLFNQVNDNCKNTDIFNKDKFINNTCRFVECDDTTKFKDIDDGICKDKKMSKFFKDIDSETLFNNVKLSYCNSGKWSNKNQNPGVLISLLDISGNTPMIDGSGSIIRSDISTSLFSDSFTETQIGLIWDPEDLIKQNNLIKCAYKENAYTNKRYKNKETYWFKEDKFTNPDRCGKYTIVDDRRNDDKEDNLQPNICDNNIKCIKNIFHQMSLKGCPCKCNFNNKGWNEFVLDNDINAKTFINFNSVKPSGLVLYLKYSKSPWRPEFAKNVIEKSLRDISITINNLKNILFLDTKVIILSKYNDSTWIKFKETQIVFQGITTLKNYEKYMNETLDLNIMINKCNSAPKCN